MKDFLENEPSSLVHTAHTIMLYRLVLCPTLLLALAVPDSLPIRTLRAALEVVKQLWV